MSDDSVYQTSASFNVEKWRNGSSSRATELLAEEVPVALEYNGARRPRGKMYPFRSERTLHGVEVGSLRFEVTWG